LSLRRSLPNNSKKVARRKAGDPTLMAEGWVMRASDAIGSRRNRDNSKKRPR